MASSLLLCASQCFNQNWVNEICNGRATASLGRRGWGWPQWNFAEFSRCLTGTDRSTDLWRWEEKDADTVMPIFAASVFVCLRFCSIRLDTDCYVCWSSPSLLWGGRRLRWAEGVLTKRPIRGWKAANDRPRAKNITVQKCLPRYRWAKTTTTTKVLCCRCCRAKKFFRICCLLFVVERSTGKWLRRLRDGVSHRVRALKKCGQADENLCEGGGLVPIREKAHLVQRGCPSPSPSLSLSRCTTLDVNLRQGKMFRKLSSFRDSFWCPTPPTPPVRRRASDRRSHFFLPVDVSNETRERARGRTPEPADRCQRPLLGGVPMKSANRKLRS